MDILDKLRADDCDTADHYEAAAEIVSLRNALRLLLDECVLAGLADATDYGWPKAYAAAQAALKRPS